MQPFTFGDEPSYLGDSATVQCSVSSGDLPLQFLWTLNSESVSSVYGIDVAFFGKKISVLRIDSLAENHAGNYTCLAQNIAGHASYSAELIVKGIKVYSLLFLYLKL